MCPVFHADVACNFHFAWGPGAVCWRPVPHNTCYIRSLLVMSRFEAVQVSVQPTRDPPVCFFAASLPSRPIAGALAPMHPPSLTHTFSSQRLSPGARPPLQQPSWSVMGPGFAADPLLVLRVMGLLPTSLVSFLQL